MFKLECKSPLLFLWIQRTQQYRLTATMKCHIFSSTDKLNRHTFFLSTHHTHCCSHSQIHHGVPWSSESAQKQQIALLLGGDSQKLFLLLEITQQVQAWVYNIFQTSSFHESLPNLKYSFPLNSPIPALDTPFDLANTNAAKQVTFPKRNT